jgi:hypothetical protein
MTGDERVRHCAKCDKDVFNLSALTAEQAESLIRERAGTLCARYYQRKDGTILLADCEIGRRGKRQRRYIAAGLALALSSGTAAAAVATHEEQRHDPDLEVIQGGVGGEPTTVLLPTQPRHWTETGIAECDAYGDAIYDYFWCDAVPSETAAVLMDSFRHAETAWKLLPDGERAAVAESCEKAKEKVEAQATEDGCTLGSGQSLELR